MGRRSGWLDSGRERVEDKRRDEDTFSSGSFCSFLTSFLEKMENVVLAHGKMSKRTKGVQ